jgi:hypothetical protein
MKIGLDFENFGKVDTFLRNSLTKTQNEDGFTSDCRPKAAITPKTADCKTPLVGCQGSKMTSSSRAISNKKVTVYISYSHSHIVHFKIFFIALKLTEKIPFLKC